MIVTGSTLQLGGNSTVNTSGMTWNNVIFAGNTKTLTSNLNISGNLTSMTGANTCSGLFNVNVWGNLTITTSLTGTSTIVLLGNGIITTAATLSNNTTINGNYILSGAILYATRTLILNGTGISTSNASLTLGVSSVVNFNQLATLQFTAITITGTTTITGVPSDSIPSVISTTTSNYTITLSNSVNCVCQFVKVSNCTLSKQGSVTCTFINSNKGSNIGILFEDQNKSFFPQRITSVSELALGWGTTMRGWLVA